MKMTVEKLKSSGMNEEIAIAIFHLVGSMVNFDPSLRPTTADLLKHGIFSKKTGALSEQQKKRVSPVIECIGINILLIFSYKNITDFMFF